MKGGQLSRQAAQSILCQHRRLTTTQSERNLENQISQVIFEQFLKSIFPKWGGWQHTNRKGSGKRDSWQMQTPVTVHTRGTALSSGSGTHTMEYMFDGNITPMEHMLRVLDSERYSMIHA